MSLAFLFRPRVRQATTVVLLLLAVSTMLPEGRPIPAWWAAQARWVALGYLAFAMILLTINRTRLMFVCLGCSAAICLFFSEAKTNLFRPKHSPEAPLFQEKTDSSNHEPTPPHR